VSLPRHPGDLEVIDADTCRALLSTVPFVRIGVVTDDGPTILPVNHLVLDGDVYFRTGSGSKLAAAAGGAHVAVEADEVDAEHRRGWSVVGRGPAEIVVDDDLTARLMSFGVTPWTAPDTKLFWVRVRLDVLSGRRVVAD
jgi:uncharacterized protein